MLRPPIVKIYTLLTVAWMMLWAMLPPAIAEKNDASRDFSTVIQPILAQKCLLCHGADKAESGLRLDREGHSSKELASGKTAIVPGRPEKSELVRRISSTDPDQRMPPEGDPLSESQIENLRSWIAAGANYTQHWAYQGIRDPALPKLDESKKSTSPVDLYVLDRLEQQNISPSAEATRSTLIRRLYYDLIGLPPSIEQVRAFVGDSSPDAYEALVDRILASPRFGERWGRHWLDMARYADSDGYEKDNDRPDAWRYRDWVIHSINDDLPFNQFTIEQLAGDLLPDATEQQRLATAFNRQTLTNTEGGTNQEQWRVAAVMDRTETLGTVWLGLSVGCARCHNHKYDQISQREYYQIFAFFNNGDETSFDWPKPDSNLEEYQVRKAEFDTKVAAVERKIYEARERYYQQRDTWFPDLLLRVQSNDSEVPKEVAAIVSSPAEKLTDAQRKILIDFATLEDEGLQKLSTQLAALKKKSPESPYLKVRVITERIKEPRKTHVLRRGEFMEPLDSVEPGTLSSLPPAKSSNESVQNDRRSDRLTLAQWLVCSDNPLVPRVTANHLWRHLFGEGIVRTVNDFGVRGEPPSHPELLDYLAHEFQRLGWSRKSMIRQIVLSATYRQSSSHRKELADIDPTNRWLYRQNRFRVEGEIVRDIALAASGLLVNKIGGPSVYPPIPASVTELTYNSSFKWKTSTDEDRFRRGMYTFFKRTAPHPNLITLDCPDSTVTNVSRDRSNTPLAALLTLNNESFVEAAQAMGRSYAARSNESERDRLSEAMQACVSRVPRADEISRLHTLLSHCRSWYAEHADEAGKLAGSTPFGAPAQEAAAWIATLRIVLNLDEFISRE